MWACGMASAGAMHSISILTYIYIPVHIPQRAGRAAGAVQRVVQPGQRVPQAGQEGGGGGGPPAHARAQP